MMILTQCQQKHTHKKISNALCTRVHLNTQTANGMCVADFIHNQVGEKEQWSKPRLKCVRTKVGEVDAE